MASTRFSRRLSTAYLLVLVAMTLLLDVFAADYTWTGNAGNGLWQDPENFTVGGKIAPKKPGREDIVTVPDSTTIALEFAKGDDEDAQRKRLSCMTFGGVGRIVPAGKGTLFEVSVPEGETLTISCPIVNSKTSGHADVYGTLIKTGKGELDLAACGVVANDTRNNYFDYDIDLDIREGVLKMPQTECSVIWYNGILTVGEGATVFLPHNSGSGKKTYFYELYGAGTLTNDCATKCELAVRAKGEFSGRLTGNIYIFTTPGYLMLTGSENTTLAPDVTTSDNRGAGAAVNSCGSIGIMKFGHKPKNGVVEPSSIGYATQLLSRDNGGAFLYLGRGEDTDKDLYMWQQGTTYPTYLDGGATGGLVWNGAIAPYISDSKFDQRTCRLVLTGSNTVACVMNGKLLNYTWMTTNYPVCVTKEGTGTWRVNYNSQSTMHGVWQVKNGALAFDTIAPAGVNSALGFSDWLYRDLAGVKPLDVYKVDHAFVLGETAEATRGSLEYVGSTNCLSADRVFAIDGTGAVLNNGTGRLNVSNFKVLSGRPDSTLVLGGENALDNVADNIADGDIGKLSVVKEGSGTWRLGTNCTFRGSLDVLAGNLQIGSLYGYYRWVIRATFTTATGNDRYRNLGLRHFGLYDAAGVLRTEFAEDTGDWHQTTDGSSKCYTSYPLPYRDYFGGVRESAGLREGHFRVSHYGSDDDIKLTWSYADYPSDIPSFTNLFCRAANWAPYDLWNRNPQSAPQLNKTNTWIVVIVRPNSGTPITSWDFVNHYSVIDVNMISNCTLEASVDGVAWTQIAEVTNDAKPVKGAWQSNWSETYDPAYATHVGMPIPTGPTSGSFAASSVSVAPDATLVAVHPMSVPKISVDAKGMGTLRGFELESGGTIDVVNAPAKGAFTVSVDFSGITLPADYSFTVGGCADRRKLSLSADRKSINAVPPGMILIVR